MIVKFNYAVVTFTPDLTDPLSEPVPVGVVAVGPVTDELGFCFVAAARRPAIAPEPDSFGLLKDLPALLDSLLREGLAQVGPPKLLEWLQARLRHTLAIGASVADSISLETELDLLQKLTPLYERHVLKKGGDQTPAASLPTVRFDVTETPV